MSNVEGQGLIPGSGRSSGEGNGNPLQYSCLENPVDRGAWWATVHGVTKVKTRLSNWHFWTVVLEKTLESPLDSEEIKGVNLKGNKPWIVIGRTNAEAEAPILRPPDMNSQLTGKDPDAGKDWGGEEKGTRGWDGWMASPTEWTWAQQLFVRKTTSTTSRRRKMHSKSWRVPKYKNKQTYFSLAKMCWV